MYRKLARLAELRKHELALTRGRQYLREISGDGQNFGYPVSMGDRMMTIIAWSRIFNGVEILCAINTDISVERSVWVTIDADINAEGDVLRPLYEDVVKDLPSLSKVEKRGVRSAVQLSMPPAGFAMFKK